MSEAEVVNLTPVPESDPDAPETAGPAEVTGTATSGTRTPDRSTIVFPYDELASAINVARTIFEHYGDRCLMDQLAGQFQQKTSSGAFRMKVNAARIFGLVTVSRAGIQLTERGTRIVDEQTAAAARVEAFLAVPLYSSLYERFKGKTLPPTNAALEAVILDEGVAPKQVRTARWRFQKSAETAGFFQHGNDRLVVPADHPDVKKPPEEDDNRGKMGDNLGVEQHPLMVGLLQSLPPVGGDFPLRERKRWLRAVETNFEFIYGPVDEDDHERDR